MTFGKVLAWNNETQRGIIEDRFGETYKFERKDFANDFEYLKVGLEVGFQAWDEAREAFAIESLSGWFNRFQENVGRFIP